MTDYHTRGLVFFIMVIVIGGGLGWLAWYVLRDFFRDFFR